MTQRAVLDNKSLDQIDLSSYLLKSGDTLEGDFTSNGHLTFNGNNIYLGTLQNTNDSGDIVWLYGNGNEKARIYANNTLNSIYPEILYRSYSESGTLLSDTRLSTTERKIVGTGISVPTGFANGSSIDTPNVHIDKPGLYLLMLGVQHCGASSLTKPGAYWSAIPRKNNATDAHSVTVIPPMIYGGIIIPMGAYWDATCYQSCLVDLPANIDFKITFTNNTGVSTDQKYGSDVWFSLVWLSD